MENKNTFHIGQRVVCNGEIGTIEKILEGEFNGLANVLISGGLVTINVCDLLPDFNWVAFDVTFVCKAPSLGVETTDFVSSHLEPHLKSCVDQNVVFDFKTQPISQKLAYANPDHQDLVKGASQQAQLFWAELDQQVESIELIAEQYSVTTLALCMYLQNAVLDDSFVELNMEYQSDRDFLSLIKSLPSHQIWLRFIEEI